MPAQEVILGRRESARTICRKTSGKGLDQTRGIEPSCAGWEALRQPTISRGFPTRSWFAPSLESFGFLICRNAWTRVPTACSRSRSLMTVSSRWFYVDRRAARKAVDVSYAQRQIPPPPARKRPAAFPPPAINLSGTDIHTPRDRAHRRTGPKRLRNNRPLLLFAPPPAPFRIVYNGLSEAAFTDVLTGAGLPADLAAVLADADAAVSRGALFDDGGALGGLIGRPTTSMPSLVAAALRG
jgi:hypothetical protein